MCWEQYNHEPNVATLRFWRAFVGENQLSDFQRGQIATKEAAGHAALALMEARLANRAFLVGAAMTLADIVLYAYTHVADEGGVDLVRYPAITSWLARVAGQPRHIAMID